MISRIKDVEQTLDLPPGYTLVALREVGDAFAHGCDIAAQARLRDLAQAFGVADVVAANVSVHKPVSLVRAVLRARCVAWLARVAQMADALQKGCVTIRASQGKHPGARQLWPV